jgi:hypothetical protein
MVQRTDDYLRPRGYYDNKGNLLNVGFDTVNMMLSGLNASATQINTLVSGGIASAVYAVSAGTCVNSKAAGYAASAGYAVSAEYAVSAGYAASCAYYEPLTNGDPITPEILFASGDIIVGSVTYP